VIIGIGHKARNGKTTIAEYLKLKYNFTIVNFADALYEECRNANKILKVIEHKPKMFLPTPKPQLMLIDHDDWETVEKNTGSGLIEIPDELMPYLHVIKNGMKEKCAPLLQWWGTAFRRNMCDDRYWINRLDNMLHRGVDYHHESI